MAYGTAQVKRVTRFVGKWSRTAEELAPKGRGETTGAVRTTIHVTRYMVVVLNNQGDLGITITLQTNK